MCPLRNASLLPAVVAAAEPLGLRVEAQMEPGAAEEKGIACIQPRGSVRRSAERLHTSNDAKRRVVQLPLYDTRQTQRPVSLAVAAASMARLLFAAALLLAQLFFAAAGADYYKARISRAATS